MTTVLVAALGGGGAGALVGVGLRTALARMRRGALVPRRACGGALAVLWAVPVGLVAAGTTPAAWLPAWLVLGALVVAGSAVDLAAHRLPDALTLPAAGASLLALLPLGAAAIAAGAAGALLLGGAFAAVHLAAPGALGAGDVKLAPALGGPLSAASAVAPVLAVVLAAAGVLVLASTRRARRVPFGPPLLLAAWVVLTVSLAAGWAP
ncbi:prepilin peptidase [Actinomycetospora lemnae]|uniref:Prepilin peptidase n=1 Tax=Actinomycetospora lemnae TaxID=3019891 RepID=A0ABT5SPI1_9PSEU|nr:prepilin peptidase [Actinomycetospora sp. DW7H6]MDD7964751.1 prepilin peptidase [Actinomycetospora sp. DW7H6]